MASSQQEVRDAVRDITDYGTWIISDGDLDDLIDIAENEIRADVDDPALSFYQGTDTFNLDLAVQWLTCLFAKIKTGEIEGAEISLGELRSTSLTGHTSIWMERVERRLHAYDGFRGFGITSGDGRDEREYGDSFDVP